MDSKLYLVANRTELKNIVVDVLEQARQSDLDSDDKMEIEIIPNESFFFRFDLSCYIKRFPTPVDVDIEPDAPERYIEYFDIEVIDEEGIILNILAEDLEYFKNNLKGKKI
jgi:hypothetical protein